jgi:hypothetical protein
LLNLTFVGCKLRAFATSRLSLYRSLGVLMLDRIGKMLNRAKQLRTTNSTGLRQQQKAENSISTPFKHNRVLLSDNSATSSPKRSIRRAPCQRP